MTKKTTCHFCGDTVRVTKWGALYKHCTSNKEVQKQFTHVCKGSGKRAETNG